MYFDDYDYKLQYYNQDRLNNTFNKFNKLLINLAIKFEKPELLKQTLNSEPLLADRHLIMSALKKGDIESLDIMIKAREYRADKQLEGLIAPKYMMDPGRHEREMTEFYQAIIDSPDDKFADIMKTLNKYGLFQTNVLRRDYVFDLYIKKPFDDETFKSFLTSGLITNGNTRDYLQPSEATNYLSLVMKHVTPEMIKSLEDCNLLDFKGEHGKLINNKYQKMSIIGFAAMSNNLAAFNTLKEIADKKGIELQEGDLKAMETSGIINNNELNLNINKLLNNKPSKNIDEENKNTGKPLNMKLNFDTLDNLVANKDPKNNNEENTVTPKLKN